MASLASLVSFGSASPSSSGHFEGSFSLVQRATLFGNVPSFHRIWVGERRYLGVCRFSVTTDYLTDQGTSVSLNSTQSKENDTDLVLKAAPKPMLKSESKTESPLNINSRNSGHWDNLECSRDSGDGKLEEDEEERNKMMESLGEVLEKAEKLETSKRVGVSVNKTPTNKTTEQRNGKPVNSAPGWNSKTAKSVWRKGNPVASVQNVVKESLTFDNLQKQEPLEVADQVEFKRVALSNAPSTTSNDVGAAPKTLTVDGNDSAAKTKERKTILIDKFASKKPVVDPLIAAAVLAPHKPGKGPLPGKFRDGFRKKSGSSGGSRRRMVDHDDPDAEALELGVSIPGAVKARKGRKWSKASRKAARLQAARDAAPVKVEILEVEEDGMLTEELAYNLATSQGKILGIWVEAIDAVPTRVEEMARKKEILDEDDLDSLEDRPPVLTIMGHVDHGKVAASEAGGITQGIGAYRVLVPIDGKSQPCVFLDTPGHEAFGAMRARGARVTDIAIIVVAADDGIRPQTNEAIAHAKAAGVPIVIAINKIDKDGANPERVMQELSSIGLMAENWGGDVPMVQISALKGENVDELLETAMLVAELQDLKANPHRSAKGTVIEAALHKSRGPVATFIVQNGTLKIGDVVVCGEAFGKVRALFDDKGNRVDEAGPSIPVQIIGLNNVPIAGDEFEVVTSLDAAREKAETRAESLRNERISAKAGDGKISLSSLASAVSAGKQSGLDLHQLNIIMKVDVQGSIEAVRQALQVLPQNNVTLKFLLQAAGDVSTSDIDLAVATKAIILGFNVKVPGSVKSYADNKGIEIRLYKVIYDLIDDVRNAMEGLLEPVEEQVKIGAAEVRAIFTSGSGRVAGCMVTEGKFVKDSGIRVLRKGKTVHVGNLSSLRRVKEMVKEVNAGLECGIGMDDFDDWEVGHTLEAFVTVQKKRTLEEASDTMEAAFAGVRM
ncbi:translation initiation factor 2, small GTP-binding protein [Actinidia rufa]|uniref:Translation initiation factor IF-2, chloroplastic n=1 Tax=Actinidia rufa TaxID=165716 RepID=A0A7J0G308_9ERIC|nr:translation initiation factor 2, small GTP-binding protein [Actinidia rufa]